MKMLEKAKKFVADHKCAITCAGTAAAVGYLGYRIGRSIITKEDVVSHLYLASAHPEISAESRAVVSGDDYLIACITDFVNQRVDGTTKYTATIDTMYDADTIREMFDQCLEGNSEGTLYSFMLNEFVKEASEEV